MTRHRTGTWLLFVLLVVILAGMCAPPAWAFDWTVDQSPQDEDDWELEEGEVMTKEEMEALRGRGKSEVDLLENDISPTLPDVDNPRVRRKLECSACWTIHSLLHRIMQALHNRLGKRTKEYDVLEQTEGMCDKMSEVYGIELMDNGHYRLRYVDSPRKFRGGWAKTLWTNLCHHILAEYEDDMLQVIHKGGMLDICHMCPHPSKLGYDTQKTPEKKKE